MKLFEQKLRRIYANRHKLKFRFMRMEAIFTEIYQRQFWGDAETRAGSGSTHNHTDQVRNILPIWVREVGAQVLLDISCGDFNWMRYVELGVETYIGADIVKAVVDLNSQRYGADKGRFVQLDITRSALPKADIIFCRDCLVHLSNRQALEAIRNIKRSHSTYLVTTTFPYHVKNTDATTGYWHPLNLQKAPFNFPTPDKLIDESTAWGEPMTKSIGLWRIEELGI